jgi:hypothetical protein
MVQVRRECHKVLSFYVIKECNVFSGLAHDGPTLTVGIVHDTIRRNALSVDMLCDSLGSRRLYL